MSGVPKGWVNAKFGDVVLSMSNGVGGTQNKEGNGIPVSRIETIAEQVVDFNRIGFIAEYAEEKIEKYRLNSGDILFSHINSPVHLGKTALFESERPLYHGINLLRIVVDRNVTLPSYFNYRCRLTRSQGEFAMRAQHAVNQSSLNQGKLADFDIALAPLPEQKRIADKLDATLARVDACRARLARVAPILKRFRQSVLAAATSGQLTADWREQQGYGHVGDDGNGLQGNTHAGRVSEALPDSNVGWADEGSPTLAAHDERWASQAQPNLRAEIFGWREVVFSEVVGDLLVGLVRASAEQSDFESDGVAYLKMNNIGEQWGYSLEKKVYVNCSPDEFERYRLRTGDWLFNTRNSVELVGKSCVWRGEAAVFNNNILRVRFKEGVCPDFVEIYFRSPQGRKALESVKSATTSVAAIYQRSLLAQKIPIPDLKEQTEIVRRVETLFAFADRFEARLASATTAAERLTPSLLAKAFRGELVPQDPNDEPASVLLQRLAASRLQERAAAGGKPKRGRKAST